MSARDWFSFARSLFDPRPDTPEFHALVAEFARIDAACQDFAAELDELDEPNPLCVGHRCGKCGVFLDRADRECPLGCVS